MMPPIHAKNTFSNFIAGFWIPPAQARYLTLECAAGKTRLPQSCSIDIDRALRAAAQSSHSWLQSSQSRRHEYLAEMGRLMSVYECSQRNCATENRCMANWRPSDTVLALARQHLLDPQPVFTLMDTDQFSEKTPRVGKLFLGSNTDIGSAFQQISPALAAGYTLVVAILHSQNRQQCLQLMSFIEFAAHSFPAGILNIVYGLGMETGLPLSNASQAVNIDRLTTNKATKKQPSYSS